MGQLAGQWQDLLRSDMSQVAVKEVIDEKTTDPSGHSVQGLKVEVTSISTLESTEDEVDEQGIHRRRRGRRSSI